MDSSQQEQVNIPAWEIYVAKGLKAIIILTAILQFARGELIFGAGILFAVALVSLPGYLNRENQHPFPVEIEILLSIVLVVHLVLGLALDFYNTYENYDKILHYGNSVLISFIGFISTYSLYFTGRLKSSPRIVVILILFMILGLGALWEIVEYSSDKLFYGRIDSVQRQQGSPTLDPLDDTMIDLMVDLGGGILGAIIGGLYIRYSRKTRNRRFIEVMQALSEASDNEEKIKELIEEDG